MDVCGRNPNRTSPVSEAGGGDHVPLCSRTNGWSWPPHPLQLLAWLLYLFFAVTSLGVFIPLLPRHWLPAGYICTGIMLVSHLCVHVMAVSMDPADQNVRRKTTRGPVPVFDRSRHAHVIENCHCYLCQVDVGPKSKHCSSCNKCVASFDHHCRLFLNSVISALLGICLVLLSASYVFIQFFLDPSQLRTDRHFQVTNDTGLWFVFLPLAPLDSSGAVVPSLAGLTIGLGLLSCSLLTHLLGFHMYLRAELLWDPGIHQPRAEPSGRTELPIPAFPLRTTPVSRAPSLVPSLWVPVQAAGPPAEYHSDSAESLEEIPVALARLGSCSSSGTRALAPCAAPGPPGFTKRKRRSREPRREVCSLTAPTVFVSQASGEPLGEPTGWLNQHSGPRPTHGSSLA
ncbi:hypothetical protein NHX12_005325 [Muraenolepis orangiensis]|uniref:Palmitoyltransferase n=1 Tax=Muraenolepis orangiensis TaxID=630683 RepID=A0A9Q0DRC8_9TELE|nr:hypothetical protein NHX12_005325 [Muraenolepis orangiensis]